MDLAIMATGPFALPTLQWLDSSPHRVRLVISRPPRSRRGMPQPGPVQRWAEERDLPTWQPEDINASESLERMRDCRADAYFVGDYGQFLSADLLRCPQRGGLNLHGSLLPRYRGAAPVQWALYHGETETGVSVIHMTPRMDAGPIVSRRRVSIEPGEEAPELEERLAVCGAEAVAEALDKLADWDGDDVIGEPQDESRVTRAPRLQKKHGRVDWSRSAVELAHQVRAFKPWPGTFTSIPRSKGEPQRIILDRVEPRAGAPSGSSRPSEEEPGRVVAAEPGRLVVACGEGVLEIVALQPAGKRVMSAGEFLRGHPMPVGTRLDSGI